MLPVLQAEEALQRMTEVGMGMGSLHKDDARRVHAAWLDAAHIEQAHRITPRDPRFVGALGQLGIAVKTVKATPAPHDGPQVDWLTRQRLRREAAQQEQG